MARLTPNTSAPEGSEIYVARLEILALMQTLNAEILGSPSATLYLEKWCREHDLHDASRIIACQVSGDGKIPTAEQCRRLQVADGDEVRYRHVRLQWGGLVVSEADNWYVPQRLTRAMNRTLETTETPFGKVVRRLKPYRQTFRTQLLWSPLPQGWEMTPRTVRCKVHSGSPNEPQIPDALFEHRATLFDQRHKPISEVREVYSGVLLAFGR